VLKLLTWISVLALAFLFGCKKDEDAVKPVITLSTPTHLTTYSALDVVLFVGSVSDETDLATVTLEVVDADFVRVVAPHSFSPRENSLDFSQGIALDDIHLESGTYYAMVTASDGTNEARKWVEINIYEVGLATKGFFIVSEPSPNDIDIHYLDSEGTLSQFQSLSSYDYGGSTVSSYHQQFSIAGAYQGDLVSYHVTTGGLLWSAAIGNTSGQSWFSNLTHSENDLRTYVAVEEEGRIKAYDQVGGVRMNAATLTNYKPGLSIVLGDRLLLEELPLSSGVAMMTVYFKASGVVDYHQSLGLDVVKMFERNSDEVYIFGNDGGDSEMTIFDVENNSLFSPHPMPTGNIRDAAQVGADFYVIAHETEVKTYTYSSNSLLTFIPGVDADKLAYDQVNQQVLVVTGNTISWYNLSGNLMSTYVHSSPITDLHVLYNK
jgi:hypothetical protein